MTKPNPKTRNRFGKSEEPNIQTLDRVFGIEMKTGNRIKPEGDSGKKKNSAVPNPNPNPNREIVQNPNKRIKETERRRGEGSGLPRRRARHHAGKRKGRPGVNCSPEQATEAPRPGRSMAARSPAGECARRRGGRRRRRDLAASPCRSVMN